MARPREFDTNATLTKAMNVFWEAGYSEAKLPDLLTGMNLTRGSLYKAFKDKKSLFLLVLNNYDEDAVSGAVAMLTDPQTGGWDRIFAVFDSIVDAVESGDHRGCLLCTAIAGPACFDSDIAAFANKSLDRMRKAFEQAVRDSSEFDNAENTARFLITQYVGMRILSRSGASAAVLRQNVEALRSLVEMGRPK